VASWQRDEALDYAALGLTVAQAEAWSAQGFTPTDVEDCLGAGWRADQAAETERWMHGAKRWQTPADAMTDYVALQAAQEAAADAFAANASAAADDADEL
jgi:hypothetical protein